MFAKRFLLPPVLVLGLAACGTTPADPNAADLLDAPTTLQLGQSRVRATTQAQLMGDTLRVRVKLGASAGLPALHPTNVYLVTGAGVWTAPLGKIKVACSRECRVLTAQGPANGLRAGQGIEVVVGLKDARGRSFLLRDSASQVQ